MWVGNTATDATLSTLAPAAARCSGLMLALILFSANAWQSGLGAPARYQALQRHLLWAEGARRLAGRGVRRRVHRAATRRSGCFCGEGGAMHGKSWVPGWVIA